MKSEWPGVSMRLTWTSPTAKLPRRCVHGDAATPLDVHRVGAGGAVVDAARRGEMALAS